MREFINRIRNDSFLSLSIKIAFVFLFLHLYQFYDSGYTMAPLIRLGFCFIYPFVAFFAGRKGSYCYFFVYANYLALTNTFQNYTAFIILVILSVLVSRFKVFIMIVYAIDIFIVSTLHDKTPVHILIHVLNCILIYYAIYYLLEPTANKEKLDLTTDEIFIINELLAGKQQKEIERFSANTVCSKLKQARERNGVSTTDELLIKYKEQNK